MATAKGPAKKGGKIDFAAIGTIVGGLVDVAQMVAARIPRKEPDATGVSLPELAERVVVLESSWAQQAPLVQQLAEQLENAAAAGVKLNQRVTQLLAVAIAAVCVSVLALLVAFLQ